MCGFGLLWLLCGVGRRELWDIHHFWDTELWIARAWTDQKIEGERETVFNLFSAITFTQKNKLYQIRFCLCVLHVDSIPLEY